jgi:hypothetical protein
MIAAELSAHIYVAMALRAYEATTSMGVEIPYTSLD